MSGDATYACIRAKNLVPTGEILNLRVVPNLNFTIQLVCSYHFAYERSSVNDAPECVKIVEESRCVIDYEIRV